MSNLPAIPLYQGSDLALNRFAVAVRSNIEAMQGRGGDKTDQAVTVATLAPIQKVVDQLSTPKRASSGSDYTIDLGGGLSASIGIEELATKLLGTAAFNGLSTSTTATQTTKSTTDNSPSPADRLITASIDRINATLNTLKNEIDSLNMLNTGGAQIALPADLGKAIRSLKESADAISPSKAGNQDGIGHNRSVHDVVSRFTQFDGASAPNNNSDDRIPGLYINRTVRVKANDWNYLQTYSFGQLADAVLKLWVSANYSGFDGIRSNYTGTDSNQPIAALKYDTLGHDYSIHDTIIGKTKYTYETTSDGLLTGLTQESTVPEIATAATLGADLGLRAKDKLTDVYKKLEFAIPSGLSYQINLLQQFKSDQAQANDNFDTRITALEAWVDAH